MALDEKVVLVFGGAGGIGAASAKLFAAKRAKVVVADINASGAEQVARSISDAGGVAVAVVADVTEYRGAESAVRETVARYGALDVVFNCAGIVTRRPLLEH